MARPASIVLTMLAVMWCGVIVAAPLALVHGTGGWLPALVYQAAGLVCHQRPERSFHLAGVQLPVCARCLGLYYSGALGAVGAMLIPMRPAGTNPDRTQLLLAVSAAPTAVTLVLEWSGMWASSGEARAVAAIPLGVALGWTLIGALRREGMTAEPARQMRYHS